MILSEKLILNDDTLTHLRTFDAEPVMDRARMARDAGKAVQGDNWFVGSVPLPMVTQWLTEAGVSWDDTEAAQDVIKRKLLSGEFAKLRVHEGTY